jgi:tripartite-type tricarboxylate transporter receptor subunit TctC
MVGNLRTSIIANALVVNALACACLAFVVGLREARADDVAQFYRGRTIELQVGTGAGGGYDANARLVARHLGAFIPGNPTIVVNNLPGGGGIRAANLLYNKSSRDGLTIGTFSNAMISEPLLGAGEAMFAPANFGWIGSASREDGICIAASSSGVTSWDDLRRKELLVGAAAPGTTTYMYPVMLRNLFGAKFKLVSGYPDGGQITLALERAEVQSICQTYSSLKAGHRDWLRDHIVYPLISVGLARIHDLPDVPSVSELATDTEQQEMLKVILAPTLAGRPFVVPPGVPRDRADALRNAFNTMTRDAGFLADAQKLGMDIEPVTGEDIEATVKHIYALPADLIARTRMVVSAVLTK